MSRLALFVISSCPKNKPPGESLLLKNASCEPKHWEVRRKNIADGSKGAASQASCTERREECNRRPFRFQGARQRIKPWRVNLRLDPFARQRRHCIEKKRRCAAEAWDAKGLACPTQDYEDAAVRLKNGSCEDDEPSQGIRIALPRERGEHGRPDRERHWRSSLIDARTPLGA